MLVQEVAAPQRRQRRWHQVHDRLYDAACELFLEVGYLGTSVDDIAQRADVARKTAFNHFPRKRDFIGEWGRRRRHQVLSAVSADVMPDAELDVVLRRFFAEFARINLDERAFTLRMLAGWQESGGPFDADPHELVDVLRGFISKALERGEISAAVDPARMATVLYGSYFSLLFEWCEGADSAPPFDLEAAFAQLVDVVMHGLRVLRPAARSAAQAG